ncbi:hypothetical protein D1007_00147 [Hordeum vulgare]|nr:hypothetical protein D1007_00147 [Hordeum vulgare]
MKAAPTFSAKPPYPLTLRNVQNVHELLKGKWTAQVNARVLQTDAKVTSSHKRKKALHHEEMTFTRNKMLRIIDNPGTINFRKSQAFSERDTGWVTPEIPRGFFTTTNMVQYSPEEDFFHEEEVVKDGDDVTIMWEGTHQHNDEDEDDEDEPITVLNLEYKHEFTTFGQHVRTDNDDVVDHDVAEYDDYDDVLPLQQFQTNPFMGHTSRDWVNKKHKFAREESQDNVKKLLDFFEKMKKINLEFFYDYDMDADNRVRNIFWANVSCRGSYEDFGECVIFDTTYKTNKFHMPLGVFVGVNHHLQSTIFVVALVRDETIYLWESTIFHQCSSMGEALKTSLPDTLHKLCRWHIMKKYKYHLALLYKAHKKLKDELTALLNHPLMPSKYERTWKELMQKYNLQNDEVMNFLWDDRNEWTSTYYKEILCARMTSTQRSESMNHISKKNFVKDKNDLHIFAQEVDKCIHTRKVVEHEETVGNESEVKTST